MYDIDTEQTLLGLKVRVKKKKLHNWWLLSLEIFFTLMMRQVVYKQSPAWQAVADLCIALCKGFYLWA